MTSKQRVVMLKDQRNYDRPHFPLQKGFIQIPLLTAIIVGVVILGGVGYSAWKQARNYSVENNPPNATINSQATTTSEVSEIDRLKQEIEKLKEQVTVSEKSQEILGQKIVSGKSYPEITANELDPFLSGIVQIDCGTELGSGSLWNLSGVGYGIMTNEHVVRNPSKLSDNNGKPSCIVRVRDRDGLVDQGTYTLDFTRWYKWNDTADISFQTIEINEYLENQSSFSSIPVEKLNYAISTQRKCSIKMAVNSPVVVIGYPSYALKRANESDSNYSLSSRISTNGVISGYENSVILPPQNLPSPNYYVSAKIDGGNSGGIAFSKDGSGLCVLGIPTWLTVGEYETQGVIQEIHNVLHKK